MIESLTIFVDWLSSDIMIERHTKARRHRCFHVAVFSLRRAICKIDCNIGIEVGAGKPELLRAGRITPGSKPNDHRVIAEGSPVPSGEHYVSA